MSKDASRIMLTLLSFLSAAVCAQSKPAPKQAVGVDTMLRSYLDLRSLSKLSPNVVSLASSRDPTGGNDDAGHFLRQEGTEAVMADMDGPGAIVRLWPTDPQGELKIYIDNAPIPVIDMPFLSISKTRQPPSTLVLLLRDIAKGETTARLARELDISRKQMHTLRGRVQSNLNKTLPTDVLEEPVFEADELYQNAGKKGQPHRDAADPPRRRANKQRGHGTYEADRPPIFSLVARQSGEVRYFMRERSDAATCLAFVQSTAAPGRASCTPMNGADTGA